MRIKEGFVLRKVAGQVMVVATGEASKKFHGMVTLNDTGRFVWQGLMDGMNEQEIVDGLTENYDVDRDTATEDTRNLIIRMEEAGFLEG